MTLLKRRAACEGRTLSKREGRTAENRARVRRRPHLEGLEDRCLLATQLAFNEFPVPTTSSRPAIIKTGSDGALWFTEYDGNKIGRIDPITHVISDFAIPTSNSEPFGIAAGPDGALWFAEFNGNKLGRIDPTTHDITEFPITTPGSEPKWITAGPDGALWFTETNSGMIGRIDATTDAVTEYPIPTAGSVPAGITSGPDGALWFTETIGGIAGQVGRIDATTHVITEYPTPTVASFPEGITLGPDGVLWFTEFSGNKIGLIAPTTHAIVELAIPTAASGPHEIATGPDGALWFTEYAVGQIGRVDMASGAITEFPIPTAGSFPVGITPGSDGHLWFAESATDMIGQAIAVAGTQTQLIASPNPSDPGRAVTFTAVVTPTSGIDAPTGPVTFTIDGVPRATVPLTVINGQARATFVISTLATGTHTVTASYAGSRLFDPSTSNRVTEVVRAPAPRVARFARYGVHWDPTRIVLTFNQSMLANSVQFTSNYVILTNPHYHNQVVRIVSARYNATTHTVTLVSATRLDIHYRYTLVVNAHSPLGVRSAAGILLDGAGKGTPGTNYVKPFGIESLVG